MNRKRRNPCHLPFPAVSALAVLLLTSLAAPVWAVDFDCRDADGNSDPAINTDQGNEHGSNNSTCETSANAYGLFNIAGDQGSSAFGYFNTASALGSSAFGFANTADGTYSSAVGYRNEALSIYSSAFGTAGSAQGAGSIAMAGWYDRDGDGYLTFLDLDSDGFADGSLETAYATGVSAVAVGAGVIATGNRSSAMGVDNTASGPDSSAVGRANTASGVNSSAFGSTNTALGDGDAAIGYNNTTGTDDYFSLSGNNAALGVGNSATGGFAAFLGEPSTSSVAVGAGNQATADNSSALGVENLASGVNSTAIGYSSVASADDSTAIGSQSVADRAGTLSVGAVGAERQIVNVDDATQDTDAVNLSQLYPLATALGAGASYAGGVFTAPTYIIQNNNYNDVGSAFAAVDDAIDDINERIVAAGGIQGEQGESAYEVAVSNGFAGTESEWLDSLQGDAGPAGPTGPEGPAGGGPRSVVYDSDESDVLTLAGAEGTRVANVADGVEATDAVNLGQMQAGDAATLSAAQDYADAGDAETLTSANAYTDQRFAELTGLSTDFEAFRGEVDDRFRQQDRRIDRMSSISGAYAGMAMNTSGLAGRNRVGVGVGSQGGERALAVGYQRAIGNRASVSIAGAFSGDEKSVSAGAGFSW